MKVKTYKDIFKTKKELIDDGYVIENAMLEYMDIDIIGHFGNATTFSIVTNCCCIFSNYNMGAILSEVIKCVVEALNLSEEDGLHLSKVKNIPIQIVSKGWGSKVEGFGCFIGDRFVMVNDVIELAKENVKERYKKEFVNET